MDSSDDMNLGENNSQLSVLNFHMMLLNITKTYLYQSVGSGIVLLPLAFSLHLEGYVYNYKGCILIHFK